MGSAFNHFILKLCWSSAKKWRSTEPQKVAKSASPHLAVEVVPTTGSLQVHHLLRQHFYIYPVTIIQCTSSPVAARMLHSPWSNRNFPSVREFSPATRLSLTDCPGASLPWERSTDQQSCLLQAAGPAHTKEAPSWPQPDASLLDGGQISDGALSLALPICECRWLTDHEVFKSHLEVAASPHALHTVSRQLTHRSDFPKKF